MSSVDEDNEVSFVPIVVRARKRVTNLKHARLVK